MASSSNDQSTDPRDDWKLSKEGIDLFLNNRIQDALALFRAHPDSIQVKGSYAFVVFLAFNLVHDDLADAKSQSCSTYNIKNRSKKTLISSQTFKLAGDIVIYRMKFDESYFYGLIALDALMSFEEDKLTLAMSTLKDVEHSASTVTQPSLNSTWKLFRPKILTLPLSLDLIKYLESQIILADSHIMVAILTFLHQDLSGYFKGGWVLRKAWKIYQRIYTEILNIYEQIVGVLVLPELTINDVSKVSPPVSPNKGSIPSKESIDNFMEDPRPSVPATASGAHARKPNRNLVLNGYKTSLPQSKSSYAISSNKSPSSPHTGSMKKSGSVNSALSNSASDYRSTFSPLFSPISDHLSYFTSAIYGSLSGSSVKLTPTDEDIEIITRLMGAVAFGYGLFQLGVSLLPPSLLKITHFFGLGCNRQAGLANLMYSRLGTDSRAPMATLALLWYHTIVRPFYAVDGTNTQAPVSTATQLIMEIEQKYGGAALFLFFQGRVERLKSDFQSALIAFQASVACTEQREIKLLSLHEVAWCNLLELNFCEAQNTFHTLKQMSRFSRIFYSYLCIISAGACARLKDYQSIQEIKTEHDRGLLKGSQLESYLVRRIKIFPNNAEAMEPLDERYWKMFVYELLYLWNSFPSCRIEIWEKMITECDKDGHEPMVGVSQLIKGSCYVLQRKLDLAKDCFKSCLQQRENISPVANDTHVSAFAEYELAYLLIKVPETKNEGKSLLHHILTYYKDYDFENRLNVRIHEALKSL